MPASPSILLNLTDDTRRRVFLDSDFERLAALGTLITFDPKKDAADTYAGLLAEADAMLSCWGSRSVKLDDLNATPRAERPLLVAHAAGSVRGVMPKAVLARPDIRLSQGAAAMVPAVAQLAVGFLILGLRQGYYRQSLLKAGTKLPADVPYRDLTGLTVGLVSLSRVALAVIPLLAPFGCRVIAWDPYWTPERAAALGVTLVDDLDELLSTSDAVSLHLPVTPETENLIDERRINLLKLGTAVANTARASVLDQAAVFARAAAGEIEYYTDVTSPEPLPPSDPAWDSPHIFITPHFAGPTVQTLRRMAEIAIGEIEHYLRGEPLQHEVSVERYDLLA